MQPESYFLDVYRAGFRGAADVMMASLQGGERMQNIQNKHLESIRAALEDNVRSMREVYEATSLDELMVLQVQLAGAQIKRTVDIWARLWRWASDMQVAMIEQTQAHFSHLSDEVHRTYSYAASATQGAARFADPAGTAVKVSEATASVREAAVPERRQRRRPPQASAEPAPPINP